MPPELTDAENMRRACAKRLHQIRKTLLDSLAEVDSALAELDPPKVEKAAETFRRVA